MIVAMEDALHEAVLQRLLGSAAWDAATALPLKGKSYLQAKAKDLNRAAKSLDVVMLVDQDDPTECPSSLIKNWLSGSRHPNFRLRVATMEVESWLLADAERMGMFLGVVPSKIPSQPDGLRQAKEELIALAKTSRNKAIVEDLVPPPGATSKVGPAYNPRLAQFIRDKWRPDAAAKRSPSLARTMKRLSSLKL